VAWSPAGSIVALIPLSAAAYAVWRGLDGALGRSLWLRFISVGLAYVAGGASYLLAAWLMRMPEIHEIIRGHPESAGAALHRRRYRPGA